MRARVGVASVVLAFTFVAACGFGVDLDGLFGDAPTTSEGGPPLEGGMDGGADAAVEAGIPTVEVQQLAMGTQFGCGRRIDGTVMCWGHQSSDHELGDGTNDSSSRPVLVKDITDAIDLAVGEHHGCVVRMSGAVACWGDNGLRQVGDGTTDDQPTPRPVISITDAQRVACGDTYSCALRKDATVQCWGDNVEGQLGDGTVIPRSQPKPVLGLADVTQIAASTLTACALVKSGEVLCWGSNGVGTAGAPPPTDVLMARKIPGLTGVTAIGASADAAHFCAIVGTGDVRCWGEGDSGNLGDAKGVESSVPVAVLGITDAIGVTTGGAHSCAVRKNGTVACWGGNDWRQLGLGDTMPNANVTTPLPVEGLTGVKQVVAGETHTCALLTDGKHISCWGGNAGHGLGRGTPVLSDVPVKVVAGGALASFAVGSEHACAFDATAGLVCWGSNSIRRLGVRTYPATGTPAPVPMTTGATKAAAGDNHTCAVIGASGPVKCWGYGETGNLGHGLSPYQQTDPVVFGAGPATDVGAGNAFTCALLGTTDVACAGDGANNRLGRVSVDTSTPVLVLNPSDADAGVDPDAGAEAGPPPLTPLGATKLSLGSGHACVVRNGGVLTCWGANSEGQTGLGGTSSKVPADVSIAPVLAVAAGGGHTCAVLQDGSVRCWGYNKFGQTTGAAPTGSSQQTPDLTGKTATAIAAGQDHSCALLNDATVLCWGRGTSGQLGNGLRTDATSPVAVKNLAGVKTIAARGNHTCAALMDGSGYCWGDNTNGELGNGTLMSTGIPAPVVGY